MIDCFRGTGKQSGDGQEAEESVSKISIVVERAKLVLWMNERHSGWGGPPPWGQATLLGTGALGPLGPRSTAEAPLSKGM